MMTTQHFEVDKLQLINTNCGNAESTWITHDNITLLTGQSVWCIVIYIAIVSGQQMCIRDSIYAELIKALELRYGDKHL